MPRPGPALLPFLLALALVIPSVGRAEPVPLASVIRFSDAIVLGRLTITDLDSTKAMEKGTGFVTVEEVVAGPVKDGEAFPFEWHVRFDTGIMCPPPYRHEPLSGVLAVWFLEYGKDGALHANGEIWSLGDSRSLEYFAGMLAALEPRTERTALLLSAVERRRR